MEYSKKYITENILKFGLGVDSIYWEFDEKDNDEQKADITSLDYNTNKYKQVPFYKPFSKVFNFIDNAE